MRRRWTWWMRAEDVFVVACAVILAPFFWAWFKLTGRL